MLNIFVHWKKLKKNLEKTKKSEILKRCTLKLKVKSLKA